MRSNVLAVVVATVMSVGSVAFVVGATDPDGTDAPPTPTVRTTTTLLPESPTTEQPPGPGSWAEANDVVELIPITTTAPPTTAAPVPPRTTTTVQRAAPPAPATKGRAGTHTTTSTNYCLRGTMANGQGVYDGAVAVHSSRFAAMRGTRWRVHDGEFAGRVFTVTDHGPGATFDIWRSSCPAARSYGRRTITISPA